MLESFWSSFIVHFIWQVWTWNEVPFDKCNVNVITEYTLKEIRNIKWVNKNVSRWLKQSIFIFFFTYFNSYLCKYQILLLFAILQFFSHVTLCSTYLLFIVWVYQESLGWTGPVVSDLCILSVSQRTFVQNVKEWSKEQGLNETERLWLEKLITKDYWIQCHVYPGYEWQAVSLLNYSNKTAILQTVTWKQTKRNLNLNKLQPAAHIIISGVKGKAISFFLS